MIALGTTRPKQPGEFQFRNTLLPEGWYWYNEPDWEHQIFIAIKMPNGRKEVDFGIPYQRPDLRDLPPTSEFVRITEMEEIE